jgi:hypothetical protein
MTDFTSTTNFSLKKPVVGQAEDLWGVYINSNFDAIDSELQALTNAITTSNVEDLGNVLNTTPLPDDFLRFNGENWSASTVSIPSSIDDLSDVDTSTTAPTSGQALIWSGSSWTPSTPTAATITDGSITSAKLDTGLQTQIGRILVTDDDDSPTSNQILKYNSTDAVWEYADLPGSTVVTLSDVNSAALANDALLVYNSTAGEFQFESGSTLRTTLGVDSAGTDNSTDLSISSSTSYDYITLSAGQVLTINQVNLGTDVTGALPVAQGGTGSTTAATARVALLPSLTGNGSKLVVVNSGATDIEYVAESTLSITESQITDLQSYLTAEVNDLSAAVTWANVPDVNITQSSVTQHQAALNITESQISDLQSYLTAETNDLSSAVTGTLGTANGGTGLTAIGTANQVLAVNAGATALEFQTLATGGTVTSVAVSGSDGIEVDSGSPVTSSGTIALGINATNLSTHLGLGTLATQNTITESQISDLGTYLTDVEHSNSVSTAQTISSGQHRMYVGPMTFSNDLTIAGKMLIFDGLYNQTNGTMNVTGTLNIRG